MSEELKSLILESQTDMILSGSLEPIKEEVKVKRVKTDYDPHRAPNWFRVVWDEVMADTVEGQLG
jgi:hypothetical protein